MSSLLRTTQATIRDHDLLPRGATVVVGVSGGADSTTLLHALAELASSLHLSLVVAHLDHCLRGERARKDLAFVRSIARGLDLRFMSAHMDVRGRASRNGVSVEMAARDARYSFYGRVCRETGATHVATGHTADDQAETFLLKLARGAGQTGLSSIAYKTRRGPVTVVRPLLDLPRTKILGYLRARGLRWVEDETNSERDFLRNRVRHEILPLMKDRLNPQLRDVLIRTADLLRADDAWLEELAAGLFEDCLLADRDADKKGPSLDVAKLQLQPLAAQRRILRQWLQRCGVPPRGIGFAAVRRLEALIRAARGTRCVPLAGGYTAHREYGRLSVVCGEDSKAMFSLRVPLPGELIVPEFGWRITTGMNAGLASPAGRRPGALPAQAGILRSAIGRKRVIVRSWRPGDRMLIAGLGGTRKLQDIFVDSKVPRRIRTRIPVFECAGSIIWLPGYRTAEGWAAHSSGEPAWQFRVEQI